MRGRQREGGELRDGGHSEEEEAPEQRREVSVRHRRVEGVDLDEQQLERLGGAAQTEEERQGVGQRGQREGDANVTNCVVASVCHRHQTHHSHHAQRPQTYTLDTHTHTQTDTY